MSGVEMAYVGMNQFLVSGRLEPGVKLGFEMTRQGLQLGTAGLILTFNSCKPLPLRTMFSQRRSWRFNPARNFAMVIATNPDSPFDTSETAGSIPMALRSRMPPINAGRGNHAV